MRIIDIREQTVPIASAIANAYIDFSKMDVSRRGSRHRRRRDGKTVVGYGFNSNGRYAQGGLTPRALHPAAARAPSRRSLLNDAGDNLDPDRIWAALMTEREAGRARRALGRGRRASTWRSGTRWRRSTASRCYRLLAERYAAARPTTRVFVYAAGGYYYPGKGIDQLRTRCAAISTSATPSSR